MIMKLSNTFTELVGEQHLIYNIHIHETGLVFAWASQVSHFNKNSGYN